MHFNSIILYSHWFGMTLLMCGIANAGEQQVSNAVDYDTYRQTMSYQYHAHFTFPVKDGKAITRIVVVEQKLEKHSLAIFDEHGYILAHAVPNLCLCLSIEAPGKVILYSGAGLRAGLGVTESDSLGYSLVSVVEPSIARSRCNLVKLQELTSKRFTAQLLNTQSLHITQDERLGICRKYHSNADSRSLHSVRISTQAGNFGLYRLDNNNEPEVTFLEFINNSKSAGELAGKMVEINRENHHASIGDEINDLCSGINTREASTIEASERLWARFDKREHAFDSKQKLELESLLRQLGEKGKNIDSTLTQFEELLHSLHQHIQSDGQRGTKYDPYDLGWSSLVLFGPTLYKTIQDSLFDIYSSKNMDSKSRLRALNLLCKIGWLPNRNASMGKAYEVSGREIGDVRWKDFVRDINQIEWQLIVNP